MTDSKRHGASRPPPPGPAQATDCVLFDGDGRLLLIRRAKPPYEGCFALPGGHVEVGETVEAACRRELFEETGLRVRDLRLVGVYSEPERDPRGHVVSVAFLAAGWEGEPSAGTDAAAASFVASWRGERLAFDHRRIVDDALV